MMPLLLQSATKLPLKVAHWLQSLADRLDHTRVEVASHEVGRTILRLYDDESDADDDGDDRADPGMHGTIYCDDSDRSIFVPPAYFKADHTAYVARDYIEAAELLDERDREVVRLRKFRSMTVGIVAVILGTWLLIKLG